ncbi:MAG: helix-turn-helix domain-containing protein [Proteobacteria bacterium]|nr:helix-turn-helix domain-containing protein [Pseudomonadota bacterium]
MTNDRAPGARLNERAQNTPLLTIKDVSALCRVSEKTVRRWIDARELPAAQLGNQWRIRPLDLDQFVRDRLFR